MSGGYRSASAVIKGYGCYNDLKFESGVHRVQRIPKTDAKRRVHTSTMAVSVYPVPDEVLIRETAHIV